MHIFEVQIGKKTEASLSDVAPDENYYQSDMKLDFFFGEGFRFRQNLKNYSIKK
jgi:hypothetical protein